MKHRVPGILAVVAMTSILGPASMRAQEAGTTAARTAVDAWLALIDGGQFAASWDAAATLFRNAVPQEKWVASITTARAPFGQMKSRAAKSATATTTLPGAPDGEYVVLKFDTSFEQKAAAVETVTAIREKDGTWHVGGYFIK